MTLKKLISKIKSQQDSWNADTLEIFNELWKRMEGAETDLEVFELRSKKQWTKGSNRYKCPNCGQTKLYFVPDYEPYWDEHMICEYCHSTYNMFDLVIKKLLDDDPTSEVIGK